VLCLLFLSYPRYSIVRTFVSEVDPWPELAWEPMDFLDPGDEVALYPAEERLPSDLDEWIPGVALAAVLETVDRKRLSGFDLVVLLRARWRMIAHLEAEAYADMSEIAHAYPDGERKDRLETPDGEMVDEIRAALTFTRRRADRELGYALDLCKRLPEVWEALASGEIDTAKARVICDGGC